jgi:hypothetical protein
MVVQPANHPAVPRDSDLSRSFQYVARSETRGRPEGRRGPRSQQVVRTECGLRPPRNSGDTIPILQLLEPSEETPKLSDLQILTTMTRGRKRLD